MQEFLDILYKPGSDKFQSFDLYVPPGSQAAKSPLVCWVHGGAWQGSVLYNIAFRCTIP